MNELPIPAVGKILHPRVSGVLQGLCYTRCNFEDIKAALIYAAKLVEEEKVYNIGA